MIPSQVAKTLHGRRYATVMCCVCGEETRRILKDGRQAIFEPEEYDRRLPANFDAEKTILGAILLDNSAHSEAVEKLEPDDFALNSHRRIFLRMGELMDTHRAVDIVTLAEQLRATKEIAEIGGVAYLASLTEGLPRRPAVKEYIRIVKEKAQLRRILAIAEHIKAEVYDGGDPALEIGRQAMKNLMTIFGKPENGKS